MPDYSSPITLTTAQTENYTAPANGFLVLHLVKYNTSGKVILTLKVNSKTILTINGELSNPSGTRLAYFDGVIPITKGDVFSSDASLDSSPTGKFYPVKWV